VFLLDKESTILRVNKAMADALGVKPEDLVGKKCHDLVHGTALSWPTCPFQRLLEDGKPHTEEVLGPNGKVLLATVSPVFNEVQEIIGAVHIAQDITVHKEAERRLILANEELRSAKDQLVQSEKMASIGQLAAGVAHEINNPVGFISNNIEVMTDYISVYLKVLGIIEKIEQALERKAWDEAEALLLEIRRYKETVNFEYMVNDSESLLKQSQDGMKRIEKIVLDLKTFSREETQWQEDVVSIESVVETAIDLTRNELKYHTELHKDYSKTSSVRCNVQKTSQVFVNLLVNAGQAIREKGIIDVKTYEKDGYVCVDIADTGSGISQDNMKRVFDPFFTTKPVGKGTGLGLSISYEIIKKQKGEIRVVSAEGEGTTFTVMLPIFFKK
jgi:two-component system NtrC family sensor kinase